MKRKLEQVFVCEKSKNPIVQGFFRRGGVQKRRALIVSKLESFYGSGDWIRTNDRSGMKESTMPKRNADTI